MRRLSRDRRQGREGRSRARPRASRELVQSKSCLTCHSVSGKGAKIAADFATSNVVGSPAAIVAGMWNHSKFMEEQARKQGVALPQLKGQELADIATYLRALRSTPRSNPCATQK